MACEVIASQGFGHTRTADIARAAGVAQALLFYHFETKDKLFAQAFQYAVRHHLDRLTELEKSDDPPLKRLRDLLGLYIPTVRSPGWALLIDAWAEAMRSPALEDASRTLALRWKRVLTTIIEDGVAAGTFTCPDPHSAAWRILSLIDGLAVQVTAHRRMLTHARLTCLVRTATARELAISPDVLS
ncbi:MAG TPA: TetR/AcrR family transcriptional regulator [Thermopolyspora sp.]